MYSWSSRLGSMYASQGNTLRAAYASIFAINALKYMKAFSLIPRTVGDLTRLVRSWIDVCFYSSVICYAMR
jgi:hypothetical protein